MDISVCIPTLNEEKCIRECLTSLKKQEFTGSYEIIIGDSESTDATLRIAKELGVKVTSTKKRTISAGRQAACEKASGKIIVSTDADVIAPKEWLQGIWQSFTPGVVGVFGNVLPHDGTAFENLFCAYAMPIFLRTTNFLGIASPPGSNISFTKEAFNKIGGFNTDLVTCEDLDIVKRLMTVGKVVYSPKATTKVSMRRVREWGYIKYAWFHVTNGLKHHFKGTAYNKYEPVR